MPEFDFPYTGVELTQEINKLPNQYGLLNAMNLAPFETKSAKFVRLEQKQGRIQVLGARPRGAPGTLTKGGTEGGVIIEIPHFPTTDNILIDDVDSLIEVIGGQLVPRSVDLETFKKLKQARINHSITLEFVRLGMLRGDIMDGDLKTLYNTYELFDIDKKVVFFDLDNDATDVREKSEEVLEHIQDRLKGEIMTGVEDLCSPAYFNKLIKHPNVEKFWLNAQNSSEHKDLKRRYSGGNYGRVFEFAEITHVEYKGSLPVVDSDGDEQNIANVEAGLGHAYPAGTMNMMRTYEAPAFHLDAINEMPPEDTIFISLEKLKHGRGFEMMSQSNRIAICRQPECLVEISAAAS